VSVLTWYTAALTAALFCGSTYGGMVEPFVALPVDGYGTVWECNDLVYLSGDGWAGFYRARDAGPLHLYYIADWPELDIAADVPQRFAPFKGLSTRARVYNITRMVREAQCVKAWVPRRSNATASRPACRW
jgi:hypothetical protein